MFNGSMVALGASGEGSNPSIPNIGEGDVSPGVPTTRSVGPCTSAV